MNQSVFPMNRQVVFGYTLAAHDFLMSLNSLDKIFEYQLVLQQSQVLVS
jgi:hypothetical protein